MFPAAIKGRDNGYTLLELLVVLTIIALIMAIIPNVYTRVFPNFKTRQFVNDLVNSARELREQARREGKIVFMEIDTEKNIIQLPDLSLEIPDFITFDYQGVEQFGRLDEKRIYFYPNGLSSGGLVSIKRGSIHIEVKFSWITGAVKVVE